MDKVSGNLGYPVVIFSPSSEQGSRLWERNSGVTGHHSSISKAIDAHRTQVDERNTRVTRHGGVTVLTDEDQGFDPGASMGTSSATANSSDDLMFLQNPLIEPATSQAKSASIESFRSIEQERPILGEPVPKGSYLDIEA